MNLDWLDIILFDLAGRPVLLIDLVSSVLGLFCVFLAGRNSKYNFWVGYLYTAALFLLFWNKNLYANLLLQPVSLAINILGHYRWTHPKSSERSSEDQLFYCNQRGIGPEEAVGLIVNGYAREVLSRLAQLLSSLKKWDCWLVWLAVNVTQIILHLSVGNVFMPIVCALYLINGLWSLASWMKLYRKNG